MHAYKIIAHDIITYAFDFVFGENNAMNTN